MPHLGLGAHAASRIGHPCPRWPIAGNCRGSGGKQPGTVRITNGSRNRDTGGKSGTLGNTKGSRNRDTAIDSGTDRNTVGADDPEALEAIKQATTQPEGRPWITDRNTVSYRDRYTASDSGTVRITNGARTARDDAGYAIERLHRERPDLHAEVLAKRLSPPPPLWPLRGRQAVGGVGRGARPHTGGSRPWDPVCGPSARGADA